MLGSVGGGVDQVLMSKLCHFILLEKSSSHALKVNLSKEHYNCAFVFGSLFFFMSSMHIIWNLLSASAASCAFTELEEDQGVGS